MEPLSPPRVPVGQVGLHPDLEAVVRRHLAHPGRGPVPEHTRRAHAALAARLDADPRPLILDSGCGTGESTLALAERHSEAWVVGVDKSVHRIRKGPFSSTFSPARDLVAEKGRALLVRADIPQLWRLLAEEGRALEAHYLLYPNPWPKKKHLMRRWHGHPAFSALLALGGRLELRTNWSTYAEEMDAALRIAGAAPVVAELPPGPALTRFEAKYRDAGHPLTQVVAALRPAAR